MRTRIDNIGQLVAVPPGPVAGDAMRRVPIISDAALLIDSEQIAWFGPAADAPREPGDSVIDAGGGCVIPGLIDCHAHAVFAGSREREWVQKIEGRSYLEILEGGGGIHSTVAAVRAATLDQLVEASRPRLKRMLASGVTTVEIKSGYGLTVDDELKMLRAAARLGRELPLDVVGTYLAAHTVPKEFAGRADEYLASVTTDAVFDTLQRERLAEFCDVFCERGAFTVEQSRRFLEAGKRHGLRAKVHADQLSQMGASAMAASLDAVSADHLEFIDDASIDALRKAGTIPVLLPGCSLFLHTSPADARRLMRAGLPVAVATDCNPGSCMIESLPLVMSLACTLMRMTPMEAVVAATANASAAIGRADRIGAIAVGHHADLLILESGSVERFCYEVSRGGVRTVIKSGQVLRT